MSVTTITLTLSDEYSCKNARVRVYPRGMNGTHSTNEFKLTSFR